MRCVCIAVLAACTAAGEPTVEQHSSTLVADAFARTADGLLMTWKPHYVYPVEATDDTLARADLLYMRACRLGDRRACVRAVPREGEVEVMRNCRDGDGASCARFRIAGGMKGPAPGDAGRRCDAGDRAVSPDELRNECAAGIALSCACYATTVFDAPDAEAIMQRGVELADHGCRAGMTEDCITLVGMSVPGSDRLGDDMECRWRGECRWAALERDACGDKVGARDLYERTCQLTQDPFYCRELGEKYVSRALPEPIAGRGARLVAWAKAREPDARWVSPLMPRLDTTERSVCHHEEPALAPRAQLAHALASQADSKLLDWMPDERFSKPGTDDTLAVTDRMYRRACTLGDHRSCWRAQHAEAQVDANCRTGDASSCNQLLAWEPDRLLPGDGSGATAAGLHHECDLGIARSCLRHIEGAAAADIDATMQRGLELAATGCARGSIADCALLRVGDPGLDAAVDDNVCQWGGWCNAVADRSDTPSEAARLRERQCRLRAHPADCGYLGRLYLEHTLPEPYLGRGRLLRDWACAQPGLDASSARLVGCPNRGVKRHPAVRIGDATRAR